MASKYFKRYLSDIDSSIELQDKIFHFTKAIYLENIAFWEKSSKIEDWISQEKDVLKGKYRFVKTRDWS